MSSNYSNEFHLPIDYYILNCSSRVSPRRLKISRLQQQISCPQQQQQQTFKQTQIVQQVPPTPQPPQITQQVPPAPQPPQITQQVPPAPRPPQSTRQVSSPTQVSSPVQVQSQAPPQVSPQTERIISGQESPFSPLLGQQVDTRTSFSLLEAFAEVIENANQQGIFSDEYARLRFEQILMTEGQQFINKLKRQMERLPIKKSTN